MGLWKTMSTKVEISKGLTTKFAVIAIVSPLKLWGVNTKRYYLIQWNPFCSGHQWDPVCPV